MSNTVEVSAEQDWHDLVESSTPKRLSTYWHSGRDGHVVLLGQVLLSMTGSHDDADVTAWEVLAVLDPDIGLGTRIVNEFYWTIEDALGDWDVSTTEANSFGYELHDLDQALPWLRQIEGCPL